MVRAKARHRPYACATSFTSERSTLYKGYFILTADIGEAFPKGTRYRRSLPEGYTDGEWDDGYFGR